MITVRQAMICEALSFNAAESFLEQVGTVNMLLVMTDLNTVNHGKFIQQ